MESGAGGAGAGAGAGVGVGVDSLTCNIQQHLQKSVGTNYVKLRRCVCVSRH